MQFVLSNPDARLVDRIMTRARKIQIGKRLWIPSDAAFGYEMSLVACHLNGCPLDLEKLLAFSDADFVHDVGGITANVSRQNGRLENLFLPRCARPSKS